MEIRKRIIPNDKTGKPIERIGEREFIYFKVEFNAFRDVSRSAANEVTDKYEARECECVLALPNTYTENGAPTQLILACHGAGSNVCCERGTIGGLSSVKECIDRGYAALDVAGSMPHGLTMGCPEHIFALYKAYRYAIKHYNLTDRVLLAGGSMGGQTALNFAHMYPSISLAIGIFFPRLNIDGVTVGDHYCIGTWDKTEKKGTGMSTHDRVADVYRFPGNEWCDLNTVGSNSYKLRSFIDGNGERVVIPPCPIKIWQGTADTVVDPVMAEEFVRSVRRSGSYIELHMLEGVGHAANSVMYEELALWFDRFI